jgi:microsomal epoxide hydrolase
MAPHEHIIPFKCTIPVDEIDDFQTLLELSKVAVPTYENQQEDRRFGVSAKWLSDTKDYWLNKYDWFDNFLVSLIS